MDGILDWWREAWQGGFLAAVDAVAPLWWLILAVGGFGLGLLSSGRVDFGSTLAAGCILAGVADWLGASAALQLALIPSTSIVLTGVFAWRLWRRRPGERAQGALVPGDVVGCAGVVVQAGEVATRVQLDGRHEWNARGWNGAPLSAGQRVRVRSRDRGLLLVEPEQDARSG